MNTLGRLVVLIIGVALIVLLGNQAVNGAREVSRRLNLRQLESQQSTVFPGTATVIGTLNAALIQQFTANPPKLKPSETPEEFGSFEPTMSEEPPFLPVTEATTQGIAPTTEQPTETAVPTETSTPTRTPSATATRTATSTAIPTATNTPTVTRTLTPTVTRTPSKTSTPTATLTASHTPTATIPPTTPAVVIFTFTPVPTEVALILPTNTRRPTRTPDVPTQTPTFTAAPPTRVVLPTNTSPPTLAPSATVPPAAEPPTATPEPQVVVNPGPTSTLPRVQSRDECTSTRAQPTAIPPRAPRLRAPDNDILNIALMGTDSDVNPGDPSFRTDTLLIVSVNRTTGTVAMLSIPRDLYVCIPSLGMQRVNVAFQWGEQVKWSPGGGFGLLQETILYNFGIPVHYYALVSLTGFRAIIDTLKGVNIAVDCPINALRYTGQVNDQQTPVYAPYSLNVGYYRMDGSLALWYARVREGTSDFDRNRRQQQILRAIWREARDQGLLSKAPELWGQAQSIVRTNLQLQDILGLVPIAISLKPEDITQYVMIKGRETKPWTTPQGENVQIPDVGFFPTLKDFYTPPTRTRLLRDVGTIQIVNSSGTADLDKVAADTLGWLGFNAVAMGPGEPDAKTVIYDYTGSASPALINAITRGLNVRRDRVISQPDPNRTVDFKVVLGSDYNSCSAPGFGTVAR